MGFIYKFVIFVSTMKIISCSIYSCPSFNYSSSDGFFCAIMEVPTPQNHNNIIKLEVELSIGYNVSEQEVKNKLSFLGTMDDISDNRSLRFKLELPFHWNIFKKKITKITLNNEIFCLSDHLDKNNLKNLVTTVNTFMLLNNTKSNPKEPNQKTTIQSVNQNSLSNYCHENSKSDILIALSDDVQPGMYPWIGALIERNTNVTEMQCGVTLITEKLALTAGHCVVSKPLKTLVVLFGASNIKVLLRDKVQVAKVNAYKVHPNYNKDSLDADLAILELSSKLKFSPTVQPICLCSVTECFQNSDKQRGIIVSWEQTKNDAASNALQQIFTSIVNEQDCLWSRNSFTDITSDSTFCAGTVPCSRGSGSGFYLNLEGRWTIRGIVSRSLQSPNGRCDLNNLVVYVDVAKHFDWIKSCIETNVC